MAGRERKERSRPLRAAAIGENGRTNAGGAFNGQKEPVPSLVNPRRGIFQPETVLFHAGGERGPA